MPSGHKPKQLKLPNRLASTEIDELMAPLIQKLWQFGFTTTYCCQGDDGEESYVNLAYISFSNWVEAALFVAVAGPTSWSTKIHKQRHKENPTGTDRWNWDWYQQGNIARFPRRDIARVISQMSHCNWTLERIGAVLCGSKPLQSAPEKVCPSCNEPVLNRRKDARYCSRECQLRARNRKK